MASYRDGNSDRIIVLIDTNAFLMAAQFRIDLFEELRWLCGGYTPLVPDVVIRELTGLCGKAGKNGAAARLGLAFARTCEQVETIGENLSPDERIISCAKKSGATVVTNDREMRNRLLSEGLNVISMRGRHKLEIIRR